MRIAPLTLPMSLPASCPAVSMSLSDAASERAWGEQLCRTVELEKLLLPALRDADHLDGPKDTDGADTYVLCAINVSSVYPLPPNALQPASSRPLWRGSTRR
jgi:hypothetical protein